ncbi:MAG: RNA 3'-terminal phosphate cyclase, partial [bacterium]
MITIDGSYGEGGGQILRSALTLSTVTGKPFTIKNIRANRPKPGLKAQHLKSVEAAGVITNAHIVGNHLNSTQLTFEPREIRGGEYWFEIGTAGSTSLVLQTIFIPLSLAKNPSWVSIKGGTHVPWAPCYHYLELQWLPFMKRLGFNATLKMVEAGFYPQGGGKIIAEIESTRTISALQLLDRGRLTNIRGISAYANLNPQVAERQSNQAKKELRKESLVPNVEILKMPARGKNTMMLLLGQFEHSQCCYYALGARGKPAEKVAAEAAIDFLNFLGTSGVFDEHLADQLLIPLALAKGTSEFKTPKITQHLLTNIEVIESFIEAEITVQGKLGE